MATTTPAAIRDRAITVIETLTPGSDTGVRFVAFRNEGAAAFQDWCEANPAGCRRRFQVRTEGGSANPGISDTVTTEQYVTLTVLVAYPQTHRDGRDAALDRDDTLDVDIFQIDEAIGLLGGANFSGAHPDAHWMQESPGIQNRITGSGVDFGQAIYVYRYIRAR